MSLVTGDEMTSRRNDASALRGDKAASTRRGALRPGRLVSVGTSPLARKIIVFNLIGLLALVAGVLLLSPSRAALEAQQQRDLSARASLGAAALEARLAAEPGTRALTAQDLAALTPALALGPGQSARLIAKDGALLGMAVGAPTQAEAAPTYVSNALDAVWDTLASVFDAESPKAVPAAETAAALALSAISAERLMAETAAAAAPIRASDGIEGALSLAAGPGQIEQLLRQEREQVLQLFLIAAALSVLLSLIIAATIANPLSDLAAAAEIGNERKRSVNPGRVRIPDLSGRPDEIGRLSGALRGMVAALYDRIDANEQFAADVAHEIKNPLASLRSAVGSLRLVKKDEQRAKLLDVIEHDVRRLDRLVSDISNASRLDSELVKEEEQPFNLLKTLAGLTEYMSHESGQKGVEFITDLPAEPLVIQGLEARLAQVFVNLISNAISFCDEGDAIRVWARRRENRVLVVVEDTGPGIPDQALSKIFKRFYSDRPESHFGNNSGLGLAISKQIVEAHGGVIWAENIRPTDAEPSSAPLGARFVVGLPV